LIIYVAEGPDAYQEVILFASGFEILEVAVEKRAHSLRDIRAMELIRFSQVIPGALQAFTPVVDIEVQSQAHQILSMPTLTAAKF